MWETTLLRGRELQPQTANFKLSSCKGSFGSATDNSEPPKEIRIKAQGN